MFYKRECVEEREGGDLQVRPTAYRHSRRNAYTARTVPPARCGSMSEVATEAKISSPSSWTHRRCGPCGRSSWYADHARAGPLQK